MKWLLILTSVLLLGCRPVVKPSDSKPLTATQIKELEISLGITLPPDTVILNSGDDGAARDPGSEFYFWVLGSTNQIVPSVKSKSGHRTEDNTKAIEIFLPKRSIEKLGTSHDIDWRTNGYRFEGYLGRSASGDYLLIRRLKD